MRKEILFFDANVFAIVSILCLLTGCQSMKQTRNALMTAPVIEKANVLVPPPKGTRIVAKVGTYVITNTDVEARCKMVALFSGKEGDQFFLKSIAPQVLEKLIDECTYISLAAQSKINVGQDDIDNFVQNVAKSAGMSLSQFVQTLKSHGIYSTLVQMGRAQVIEYVVTMGAISKNMVRVTEAQIQEKIDKIQADEKKTQYSLLEIVFYPKDGVSADKTAEKTYEELIRMSSEMPPIRAFQTLAKQLSQSSTAKNSGDRGWVTASDLGSAASIIGQMEIGSFSKPLKIKNGEYCIFFLNDVKQPGLKPASETKVEMSVVTIPITEDMSTENQNTINRRLVVLLASSSPKELEGLARDFGYSSDRVTRTRDVLPSEPVANKCFPPFLLNEHIEIVMPIRQISEKVELVIDKMNVQTTLENQMRSIFAEKLFKGFKNRTLIVIYPHNL
jgi:parvulin-like peptidyl-prolyl isomerase